MFAIHGAMPPYRTIHGALQPWPSVTTRTNFTHTHKKIDSPLLIIDRHNFELGSLRLAANKIRDSTCLEGSGKKERHHAYQFSRGRTGHYKCVRTLSSTGYGRSSLNFHGLSLPHVERVSVTGLIVSSCLSSSNLKTYQ